MILVLVLLVIAVYLFSTEKLPVDLVALLVMATLLLTGIISPEEGIAGFSNTATVTVGAMFILSAGLFRTGAVNFFGLVFSKIGKRNFWLASVTMMIFIGGLSAFVNNTAVVAIFLPIVLGLARRLKVSASKLLMPLSYSSMFGGVCTLIGTSTNILVSSIAERYGVQPFSMFEFTKFGLLLFAAGIIYMMIAQIRLLPDRGTEEDLAKNFGMDDYTIEIHLPPGSRSIGSSPADSPLLRNLELSSVKIYREDTLLDTPLDRIILKAGDMLRLRCNLENVQKLRERKAAEIVSGRPETDDGTEVEHALFVEAVIAPNSPLAGRSLKEVGFDSLYNATAHAIRHGDRTSRHDVETIRLRPGDALLVETKRSRINSLKKDGAFVVVSEMDTPVFRKRKIMTALTIIGAVVVSAALGLLPIVVSAIAGCLLMILTECITLEEAYKSIDWKVIFLLAGVLTLGAALEKTGAAQLIASTLVSSVGLLGPIALVSIFYLLTSLLTETMSNNATAALLAPVAIVTANSLGVDPRPFLMAVAYAASASFMTPVGYQTNTLIYGPGRYRFSDYLKVGAPLNFLFWILATIFIPRFWPF
ncbi:MAG: sodium-coupled transporter [Acidobacteria bacterium]|nr:sodium-coupled transporter [Acidobacteriota bacterium]